MNEFILGFIAGTVAIQMALIIILCIKVLQLKKLINSCTDSTKTTISEFT